MSTQPGLRGVKSGVRAVESGVSGGQKGVDPVWKRELIGEVGMRHFQ